MKTERVKSIEIWRIFFVCMVVVWHTRYLFWIPEEERILRSGHAVDFFLLLSGFLMAKHSEKPMTGKLGKDSLNFLLHKVKGFYSIYLLAIVFALIGRWLFTGYTVEPEDLRFYIWDLLLLRETGLHGNSLVLTAVGASWYLMAMMLAMAVLYPLLRKNRDVFLHIIAPLLTVFLYGWFCQTKGKIYFTMAFDHGVSLGILRAVAGISFGCVCYLICEKIKPLAWSRRRPVRIAATLTVLFIAFAIILCSVRHKAGYSDFLCILLEALLLISEFCGLSLLNDVIRKWRVGWIGSFSLSLYLSHFTWIAILNDLEPAWPKGIGLLTYFATSIVTAIGFVWIRKGIGWVLTFTRAPKI